MRQHVMLRYGKHQTCCLEYVDLTFNVYIHMYRPTSTEVIHEALSHGHEHKKLLRAA